VEYPRRGSVMHRVKSRRLEQPLAARQDRGWPRGAQPHIV